MKKDTIANGKESIKRHIEIPTDVYRDVEDEVKDHNRLHDLHTKYDKIFIQDMLPLLVADGISHRRRNVFVGVDKKMQKDPRWKKLMADAVKANKALREYESTL